VPSTTSISVWLPFVAVLIVTGGPLRAQRVWSGTGEAAASLLQGNTDQRTLSAKSELGHADSTLEVRSSLSFIYSDASRDSLPRQVDRRTWIGALALDYRPYGRFSPFMFLNYEASYEKRVLDRVGLGAGGKLVIVKNAATTANVSLAVLAERTRPTALSPDTSIVSILRWSGRVRLRHQFDAHLSMSQTTYYQPRLTQSSSYTVNSTSEVNYSLRKATSVVISYFALYDSDARNRGARRNNDAQILFGVKTGF